MALISRVIIIVLDSVGVGALPDAGDYGDEGSNTLVNTARAVGGLDMPGFQRLGLGNIVAVEGVPPAALPDAAFGKMAERSAGKDTTVGHWEMMGVVTERPFPTYPRGFPPEIVNRFEAAAGTKIIGNRPASGTEIIEELGPEHMRTGHPIIYTSADSVFQIAAHKDVVPVDRLYELCIIARSILTREHAVGRVIARPFTGEPGRFVRTNERKDYSLPPPGKTVLDYAADAGVGTYGVGKIADIFTGRGVAESIKTASNAESMDATVRLLEYVERGVVFVVLTDFDTLWGHRNDAAGYAAELERVDGRLPELFGLTQPGDIVVLTADHGCDPTTPSTDHSREYVPLLVAGPEARPGVDLGTRKTFADLGKSAADMLGFAAPVPGESFRAAVIKG